jgi:hypothetical protein
LREEETASGAFLSVDSRTIDDVYQRLKQAPRIASVSLRSALLESYTRTMGENLLRMRAINLFFAAVVYAGFALPTPLVPVPAIFVGIMFSMAIRNLSYNTLTSRVPEPHERAAFMSVQSAVQHFAAAIGAIGSSMLLAERADKSLEGMPRVAWVSIATGLLMPLFLWVVERGVTARKAPASVR